MTNAVRHSGRGLPLLNPASSHLPCVSSCCSSSAGLDRICATWASSTFGPHHLLLFLLLLSCIFFLCSFFMFFLFCFFFLLFTVFLLSILLVLLLVFSRVFLGLSPAGHPLSRVRLISSHLVFSWFLSVLLSPLLLLLVLLLLLPLHLLVFHLLLLLLLLPPHLLVFVFVLLLLLLLLVFPPHLFFFVLVFLLLLVCGTCQYRLSSAADKGWRCVPDAILPGHRRAHQ